MNFKRFLNSVDMEIEQIDKANIVRVDDKGRKAVMSQIIKWTNGTLNFLSSVNPDLWSRQEEFTVTTGSSTLTLPFQWKTLESIVYGNKIYHVTAMDDSTNPFYAKSANEIGMRSGEFTPGMVLTFIGVFNPTNLTDPLREDYAVEADYYTALDTVKLETVDINDSFIDLVKLKVLLSYAAKSKMQTPQWYSDYIMQLKVFERSSPPVEKVGGYDNEIPFGRL